MEGSEKRFEPTFIKKKKRLVYKIDLSYVVMLGITGVLFLYMEIEISICAMNTH